MHGLYQKNYVNDITKIMNNNHLVPCMMYNNGKEQVIDKTAKESLEIAVDFNNNDEPWLSYKMRLWI